MATALCLFLLIVAAKWATIERFGSDIPNWDQWDAEGYYLLAPWFENNRFLEHLFFPHNEHRVVLTKLECLGLALASGQWDSRLEMVVNAMLHAVVGVMFWSVGRRWMAARWRAAYFIVLVALFALPLGWQNTIGGFHSQQYWLLVMSMAAMLAWPFARPWSAGWWGGFLAAGLSLLTMASGVLAPAAVFGVVGYRVLRGGLGFRSAWPTLLMSAMLVLVGLLTRVSPEHHEPLYAKTVRDFVHTLVNSLQWPIWRKFTWPAVFVLWAPWAVVTWRLIRNRDDDAERKTDGADRTAPELSPRSRPSRAMLSIAALGGWVLLQVLATAYARGAGGDRPASRYMDTLGFGMAVNALALGWWLSRDVVSRKTVLVKRAVAAAWILIVAGGVTHISLLGWREELPGTTRYLRAAEALTRAYLMTGDQRNLMSEDIPYPGADSLRERLTQPSLAQLMPLSVRPPLRLVPAEPQAGFVENQVSNLDLEALREKAPRAGLSDQTAALASFQTWGSFVRPPGEAAIAEWRSRPVTPGSIRGWLKFETAGHVGDPAARETISLQVLDAQTGKVLSDIRPTRVPGNSWRAAYVPAPRRPFIVLARDADAARWLAFSEPVEMSTLSYWAWQATKQGILLFWTTAMMAVALGVGAWMVHRKKT